MDRYEKCIWVLSSLKGSCLPSHLRDKVIDGWLKSEFYIYIYQVLTANSERESKRTYSYYHFFFFLNGPGMLLHPEVSKDLTSDFSIHHLFRSFYQYFKRKLLPELNSPTLHANNSIIQDKSLLFQVLKKSLCTYYGRLSDSTQYIGIYDRVWSSKRRRLQTF